MNNNGKMRFLTDSESLSFEKFAARKPVRARGPAKAGAGTTTSAPEQNEGFGLPLTRHATARCSQRGIKKDVIDLVVANFDRDYGAREGAAAISISRERLAELEGEGIPRALIGLASRTVLIVRSDGAIVTAINRPTWFARFHHGAERLSHRRRRRSRNHRRFRR
jgi:hypothetical protein